MTPYIIHHHLTPASDTEHRELKYRSRRRRFHYDNARKLWILDDYDSTYGDPVYTYEPDYHLNDTSSDIRHNNHYSNNRYSNEHFRHHAPQFMNTSPQSEPPFRSGSEPRQYFELGLKTYRGTKSEPRIAVFDQKPGYSKHSHCDCHARPEKSSKMIPTMHYDELRCPHCAAFAQPTQDEILAYPWTVQSYRPNRRREDRVRSLAPEKFSSGYASVGPESLVPRSTFSKAPSMTRSYRSPSIGRDDLVSENKENSSSLIAPTQPLFRKDSIRTWSELKGRISRNSGYPESTVYKKRGPAVSVIEEHDDDVKPHDSISNVSLPPLRAESIDLRRDYKRVPRNRADSNVDTGYTRQKYFQSLDNMQTKRTVQSPRQEDKVSRHTLPTPRPAKDTASEISRMLKGKYYDRRNGRTYTFNVNYARSQVKGIREPKVTA